MRSTPPDLARSALEAAPDAMLIVDDEGIVRFVNRQVFALFGYTDAQVLGQPVEMLMPERFRARHLSHRSAYAAHMRARPMGQSLELYGQRRDGTEFPVEISLSPIADGDRMLVVAAIRDVSDRVRIQKELIAARAVAEEARESADRANQGKSRFLATASHDLRQPLQALALLNGTLRRTVHDPLLTEGLAQQERAIGAMSRLLNALLDISKLESGAVKPEITEFSVARVLEEMRREFASIAAHKGLTLAVIPGDACVRSDPSLVEQAVRNLVSNAIKYTRAGTVTVYCPTTDESLVRLEIQDTGIGIASDQLSLIYDEFYQVGVGPSASPDGYGLGLAIVKRIVQLLDLKLEVSSRPGEGSTFSLLLPAASDRNSPTTSQTEASPGTVEPQGHRGRPSVMLVEDDLSVRDATQMLLRVEGYEVIPAVSLETALQAVENGARFDLLVTDYHLGPSQTGMQVIAALRERFGRPINAILITGDTSRVIRDLAPDPHLRILSKPIRAEALLGLLREFLDPHGAA